MVRDVDAIHVLQREFQMGADEAGQLVARAAGPLQRAQAVLQHAGVVVIGDQEEELLLAPLLREHRRGPAQHVLQLLVVGHGPARCWARRRGPWEVAKGFRTIVRTIPTCPLACQAFTTTEGNPQALGSLAKGSEEKMASRSPASAIFGGAPHLLLAKDCLKVFSKPLFDQLLSADGVLVKEAAIGANVERQLLALFSE